MEKYKKFIPIIILLLSFWAVRPLFNSGFFPIHDDEQVGRLYELHQSLKAGQFPVRISQDLGFGYGYPLFNFYPPFVYYIAEVFVLVGFGYITSIKLMIGLGFVLAAVAMYYFAKEYFGKTGGIISAIAYTYVPYHAVDVYVRGALPEFWAFVFVPAIFLSYKKLHDYRENKYVIISGVLLAAFVLTHNLIAMMSGIFIGIYLLYLYTSATDKKRFLRQVLVSGILGLGLSASFWIPSFFERQYTMIDLLTKELADYRQHFVYLRQLWDSPWGYGGSLYGLLDGLSFQIGKVHIIGSFLGFCIGIYLLKKRQVSWRIIMLFIFSLGFATFMTTFYSEFIWNSLQFFAYIQFPWRFLLLTGFFSSFLLGSLVLFTKSKKFQFVIAAITVSSIIFLYKDYFKPKEYFTRAVDKDYINLNIIKWRTSIMAFEYIPKGVATKKSLQGTTVIDIDKAGVADQSFTAINGNLQVEEQVTKPQYKMAKIKGDGGTLRINTFSFPGWKIFIDKAEVKFSDGNKLKLIDVEIPEGAHIVEAKFTDTNVRIIGNTLSVGSILGVLLYIITLTRKREGKISNEKHNASKK